MIICNLTDKKFNYEFEKVARLFYPFERITVVNEEIQGDNTAVCEEEIGENFINLSVKAEINGKAYNLTEDVKGDILPQEKERKLSVLLYNILCRATEKRPPWGILTGVRPARLYLATVKQMGKEAANRYFREELLVSPKKISLCEAVAEREDIIIKSSASRDFSLYISIPFCPSRCSYCSFVSHSVESAAKLIPDYIDHLCREIEITANKARAANLHLKTIYMGGGTPTTLSAEELKRVIDKVFECFDTSKVSEFTVEAGRPDTITEEKLKVIKQSGVTRISVNPQTLCDDVLKAIGRKHTSRQFYDAFSLARKAGLNNINCDLIAGLPTDDIKGFSYTLSEIIKLSPESITVHALSMKRAANINQNSEKSDILADTFAWDAVSLAAETLNKNGYLPYYTYRQSKTVGNLENVGYSKEGYEGLYNVFIMDETHTILAVGASAVTKLRSDTSGEIKRIFNYKYPYEYINHFDKLMEEKQQIECFFNNK